MEVFSDGPPEDLLGTLDIHAIMICEKKNTLNEYFMVENKWEWTGASP